MAPRHILPDAKDFREMKERYTWGDIIGSGSYGVVMRGFDRERNRTVAVKRIRTKELGPLGIEKLLAEVNILNLLYRHPNVMEIIEQYEGPHYAFLVIEYANDGTLEELYNDKEDKTEALTERGSWSIIRQLTEALTHCYEHGVVHRDIKPSNVLLHETDDGWRLLLLADFGLGKICDKRFMEHKEMNTVVGTMKYLPPEIFQRVSYNYKCDIWSLGVLIFVTLSGSYPFLGGKNRDLYGGNVMKGAIVFRPDQWEHHSNDAKSLVRSLLQVDPTVRYNYEQIRSHPWFSKPSFLKKRN